MEKKRIGFLFLLALSQKRRQFHFRVCKIYFANAHHYRLRLHKPPRNCMINVWKIDQIDRGSSGTRLPELNPSVKSWENTRNGLIEKVRCNFPSNNRRSPTSSPSPITSCSAVFLFSSHQKHRVDWRWWHTTLQINWTNITCAVWNITSAFYYVLGLGTWWWGWGEGRPQH